jgi:predicted outer membrane protein
MTGRSILWLPLLFAVLGTLCANSSLPAQYGPKIEPAAMSSNYNPLAWRGDDAKFALDTLHSSYCASQISKFVAGKTTNKAVQDLAFTQAYDHQKVYKKLHGMARTFNVKLPSKDDLEDCPATARLRELTGAELDRSYVVLVDKISANDVSRFEAEAQMPREPSNWSLWSFAQSTLPVMREDAASVKILERNYRDKK